MIGQWQRKQKRVTSVIPAQYISRMQMQYEYSRVRGWLEGGHSLIQRLWCFHFKVTMKN